MVEISRVYVAACIIKAVHVLWDAIMLQSLFVWSTYGFLALFLYVCYPVCSVLFDVGVCFTSYVLGE